MIQCPMLAKNLSLFASNIRIAHATASAAAPADSHSLPAEQAPHGLLTALLYTLHALSSAAGTPCPMIKFLSTDCLLSSCSSPPVGPLCFEQPLRHLCRYDPIQAQTGSSSFPFAGNRDKVSEPPRSSPPFCIALLTSTGRPTTVMRGLVTDHAGASSEIEAKIIEAKQRIINPAVRQINIAPRFERNQAIRTAFPPLLPSLLSSKRSALILSPA